MEINKDLVEFTAVTQAAGISVSGGELMQKLFHLNHCYPISRTSIENGIGTLQVSLTDRLDVGKAATHSFTITFSQAITALNVKLLSQSNAGNNFRVDKSDSDKDHYTIRIAGEQVVFPTKNIN